MSRADLESLFSKPKSNPPPQAAPQAAPQAQAAPITATLETPPVRKPKEAPLRPCGCRTWFQNLECCPICGKRVLRGVMRKPMAFAKHH